MSVKGATGRRLLLRHVSCLHYATTAQFRRGKRLTPNLSLMNLNFQKAQFVATWSVVQLTSVRPTLYYGCISDFQSMFLIRLLWRCSTSSTL